MSRRFVHSRVMPATHTTFSHRTARVAAATAIAFTATATILAGATGCGEHEAPPPDATPAEPVADPGSDWRQLPETVVLELSESDLEAFRDAAARARAAAPSARDRFTPAAPGEPDAWFALVALPVERGEGSETVWVAVDAWSEHRIEGRLASPPSRPLRDGRTAGDTVSFSTEELLDWLHRPRGSRVEEGGFTIDALEARRGAVEMARPTRPPEPAPADAPERDAPGRP